MDWKLKEMRKSHLMFLPLLEFYDPRKIRLFIRDSDIRSSISILE